MSGMQCGRTGWTSSTLAWYRLSVSSLRVPVIGIQPGRVELDADASRYVAKVHRLRAGALLLLFDPEQCLEADAVVRTSDRHCVGCDVDEPRPASLVAPHPLWVLQGLSKGDRFDQAVRDSVALGVTDIVPVAFARSDGNLTESSEARRRRWNRIAVEASRQCGRGDVARIHVPAPPEAALTGVPEGCRLCLWERSTRPLITQQEAIRTSEAISIVVGPEGGLEDDEVGLAHAFGYVDVSLGSFVLRTETATTAALGAVRALRG